MDDSGGDLTDCCSEPANQQTLSSKSAILSDFYMILEVHMKYMVAQCMSILRHVKGANGSFVAYHFYETKSRC